MQRHAWLRVVPRDETVADLTVALEIHEAVAVHPQHRLERLGRHRGERVVVAGRLDDDLGGAARREHVEHPYALAHQLPLDAEIRVPPGHDAHGPAPAVRRGALLAVRRDPRPGGGFGPGTRWAVAWG